MEEMSLDLIIKSIPNREEVKNLNERDIRFIISSLSNKLEDFGYNTTSTSNYNLNKRLEKAEITKEEFEKIWNLVKYFHYICEVAEKSIPL